MSARQLMDLIIKADPSVTQVRRSVDDNDESFTDTTCVLPTNKVYIPVNKALVKKNGTVPANTPDSLIADTLRWTINKSYLLKADLMILDLLATFNWERPVYFAVTAGGDSYLNLDDWFNLEGLAYRLVPMRADKRGLFGEMVGCNTGLMYNNIMKNFRWGGLDKPGVNIYMDENNLRFTTNQRLQMMSLAKMLNDEGKSKEAVEVLDRCLQVMPTNLVPLEPAMVYAVEGYYKAGAIEKANKLSKELFTVCEGEFRFFNSVASKSKDRGSYEGDLGRLNSALEMLHNYSQVYGQKDLESDYAARMTSLGIQPRPAQPQFPDQGPKQPAMNMDSLIKAMESLKDSTDPNNKSNM
jgi:tetratricopeptide (TPR) repeat protein